MKFTKMHGCGNDYIYVDCTQKMLENPRAVSKYVSDRHFGIGSDGLILICSSDKADFRMRMYNSDGSEGKMCGNGIRCVGKYVYDRRLTDKTKISVETNAGIKYLDMSTENGKVAGVRVNMGSPAFKASEIPVDAKKILNDENASEDAEIIDCPVWAFGKKYRAACVSMGNPHMVTFVEETASFPVEKVGSYFETADMFPDRANIEFVQVVNEKEINMRVWERGAGETLACGTGACACVCACVLRGYTNSRIIVHLLGGDLEIEYDRTKNTVWMTGPAETVFDGEIDTDKIR